MGSHERRSLALILLGACAFLLVDGDPTITRHDGSGSKITKRKLLDELDKVAKKESKGILETVDGNPEFQVRVKGQDKPLCFQLHGQTQQVFRLVQDPHTGIIVNARVFVDDVTHRTYLGAIVISKGKFRVLAKQHVVLVNKIRFNWNTLNTTTFQGHRVLVAHDRVIVTFRKHKVVLEIRRSFLKHPKSIVQFDNDFTTTEPDVIHFPDPTEQEGDADRLVDPDSDFYSFKNDRDGSRLDKTSEESFADEKISATNSASSSMRWPGLFSWAGSYSHSQQKPDTRTALALNDDAEEEEEDLLDMSFPRDPKLSRVNKRSIKLETVAADMLTTNHVTWSDRQVLSQNRRLINQLKKQMKTSESNRDVGRNPSRYPTRTRYARPRKFRRVGRYKDLDSSLKVTFFLGFYILDGRDFSNRTHGLLGQFLFKSATTLKLNWGNSGGVLQAILMVDGDPDRTASAVYTKRQQVGRNTTLPCWLLTDGGRNVIDGTFMDYIVPHIRYSGLRELPPPAPL